MRVTDLYDVRYQGKDIGVYYVFSNASTEFAPGYFERDTVNAVLGPHGIKGEMKRKGPIPFFAQVIRDENRLPGRKRPIYVSGDITLERRPNETGERFLVYSRSANKGSEAYSSEPHDAPHNEGPNTPEGMREWASWYAFEKMDDGTYRAELDEAWWWGGGHNDGGTIRTPIPEEWFSLPWKEFLDKVVDLSSARHYGFDAEHLKDRKGLKEFFGMAEAEEEPRGSG